LIDIPQRKKNLTHDLTRIRARRGMGIDSYSSAIFSMAR